MMLLVGLGNPGASHAGNRHNIGFMAVDTVVHRHGFPPWRARHQGMISEGRIGGARVTALKPMTYMNESGRSVGLVARYLKIPPADIIVAYDELDLAPGKVRVKTGGGTSGHNGLRSIAAHIGPDYRRLRLGIGHPGDRDRVTPHVLGDFANSDGAWLDGLFDAIAEAVPLLLAGDDSAFMSKVALLTAPPKPPKAARPSPREGADDGV